MRTKPADQAVSIQNPPGFSWARAPEARGYELSLRGPDKSEQVWRTSRNWFLPDSRLKPGEYSWKVRPTTANGPWSSERRFSITGEASVFIVPSEEKLLQFIRARSRPRSLPTGEKGADAWAAAARAQQASAIQTLENQVRAYTSKPPIEEQLVTIVPRSKDEKAWAASLAAIRNNTQAESRQLRAAALLWRLTGNRFYLEEAKRRGDALAALDPDGSTSHVQQDQGNRSIAWGLTTAYDYLAADLEPRKNAIWLDIIKSRTTAIYADLKSGEWRLEQNPLDSHGATNLGYLAAISALMLDSLPDAENWFRNSFRAYVNYQSPWGDEEGGYGNGSAYAEYSAWAFVDFWDSIAAATGVSIYEKPWSKGLFRFLACFVPPGNPSHTFGDAAETKPYPPILKAFANRYEDGLSEWYSQNLTVAEDVFTALTNPVSKAQRGAISKAPEKNACIFKYIGWAGMHSRWADPKRTSIYFKSSRYGSFSHSHADQNSFTLVAAGRPLFIDSGAYDWHGSPHWKNWYRQTAAHNAITYDNGKGQVTEGDEPSARAQGRITRFETTSDVDFVEGDATRAYGGKLTKANRKLWFIRSEGALVIRDDVASDQNRVFEWNAHALSDFRRINTDTYEIRNGDQTACLDFLSPNDGSVHVTEGVPIPPVGVSNPKSWRLRYEDSKAAKSSLFVVAIRVNCAAPRAQLDGTKVTIGKTIVNLAK